MALEKYPLVSEMFVEAMNEKLKKKQREYGDSWRRMPLNELIIRFRQEVGEFLLDQGNKNECVDVANMAMFLYIRLREIEVRDKVMRLEREKTPSNGVAHCNYCNCDIEQPFQDCRCKCHDRNS